MPGALPLQPIDPDFRATIERALSAREATRAFVSDAVAAGVSEVVFVGVGGSFSSSIHATFLLNLLAPRTRVANLNAAEFVHATPARVGAGTVVVASSHGGATPETLAAAEVAKRLGARVVAVSSEADTPLGRLGDLRLNYANDQTITPAKHVLLAGLVAELLRQADGVETGDLDRALTALPAALEAALLDSEALLADIGRSLHERSPVWIAASGSGLGAAYTMSICHLVEMQWMPSAYFAAGDYFHGPFELLTEDAQLLVFAGEDPTRPETDRVVAFAERVSRAPHLIDTSRLPLDGVPPTGRGFISAVVLGALGSRLLSHVEAARGHDHGLRRYMHKVAY